MRGSGRVGNVRSSPVGASEEDQRMSTQWEHKVLTYKLKMKGFDYGQIERDLNELGREGWEALGTMAPSWGAGQTIEVVVLLKRSVD